MLNLPRGIRDIPPELYEKYLAIFDTFRRYCIKYGYQIMEPATIEFFDTLALKSGPDIANEIYEFYDKSGRHIALRFDLTVGLARYVVTHPELPKPVKLAAYSIQWRYDEPQFGRYRSFYAWDVEIFGGDEVYSAADVILFVNSFLSGLGLKDFEICISDRRLVEAIIKQYLPKSNVSEEIIESVMRIIDKWGKLNEDEIVNRLLEYDISEPKQLIAELFKSTNYSNFREYSESRPLDELYGFLRYEMGLNTVKIDLSIVRGLDYYDGIVFEVKVPRIKGLGSIVGGGNYKKLMEVFGGDINAFGAAGGVERLIIALESLNKDVFSQKTSIIKNPIIILPTSEEYRKYAFKLAEELRPYVKYPIHTPVVFKGLSKSLRKISKLGFRYAVIIGKHEISNRIYKVKDLSSFKEYTVYSKDELINLLNNPH